MAKSHKNQHTVPESYLRAWCDPTCPPGQTPYVWITSRDGRETRRKAPSNLFSETDFYTIHLADGTRDLTLEHGLSQLEGVFARLRRRKVERGLPLTHDERLGLCMFCAAMHARTKAEVVHQQQQWGQALRMCREIEATAQRLPPEQWWMLGAFSSEEAPTLSMEELERIVEHPVQTLLKPMIEVETPLLLGLDMAFLCAEDDMQFVTSDDPCVWVDPEVERMPPAWQAPALAHQSIQIRLPISPHYLLLLNRQGIKGSHIAQRSVVDQVNRATVASAYEYVVHQTQAKRQEWFG